MDRSLALFAIGLVFGGGIGFAIAASSGVTFDGHDHGDPAAHGGVDHGGADHARMHGQPITLAAEDAPSLAVRVTPDPMSGHNLFVETDGFDFAPQNASGDHQPGEGHAHVYVNGTKIGRLYGPWLHLPDLPKGAVTVEVTLNANDHRPLAVNGAPITAREVLTVE
ncbi:hypothetical protein WNY61_01965 [Sulfitobacter sp. AS92]|uniref:hypothetical protein n=1 Tax=Sulfitobacter sp. AS92 TaxID=3135783 RepID=UPI0031821AD4